MNQPDPQPTLNAATIEDALNQAALEVAPEQFTQLIGAPGLSIMRSAMEALKADSITLWFARPDRSHLVVIHTEPDPDFLGFELPVEEGLVALVFASEQCLCENQVFENEHHSKKVDAAMGQFTYAMIAAPFYIAGNLKGVVSCVQLKPTLDSPDPPGFSARNMNSVRRLSAALERLSNYKLLTQELDLEL